MVPNRPSSPPRLAPVARAERFIGAARVVLAAGSLFAIWLDPSSPAKYATVAYSLLTAYVGYAAVLVALRVRRTAVPRGWPLATHAVDLMSFGAFMFFTEGSASPFFVYFIFSLVAATIRWQSRGATWTALVALVIFISLSVFSALAGDPSFETNRFIIRCVYLAVAATLLHYLGRYHERLAVELSRIAAWGWRPDAERRSVLANMLEHVGAILQAPHVLLLFEEPEEPWVNVVTSGTAGGLCWDRAEPDVMHELERALGTDCVIGRPKRDASGFQLAIDAGGPGAIVVRLEERVAALLGDLPFVTCPLVGDGWSGRVFGLGRNDLTADDVRLAEVVSTLAAPRLEHMFLLRRLREAAVGEERMRFGRDLHDGILQSLAGAALQLRVAERLVEHDPREAQTRIREVEEILAGEQRDLREFVAQLKSQSALPDHEFVVSARLEQLAARIGRQWGIDVDLSIGSLETVPRAPRRSLPPCARSAHQRRSTRRRHDHPREAGRRRHRPGNLRRGRRLWIPVSRHL